MKKNTNKNTLVNKILMGLLSSLLWAGVQAAKPLWTIVPAPGSNPTQTVLENETANVLYMVHNQSGKPKKLIMQPMPGITQITPCRLSPKGQAGDSCSLTLTVTGSALPKKGIHDGPILCQADFDNHPNPNQCYRPSDANSLDITSGPAASVTISVNPSTLLFFENSTSNVIVTNNASSSVAAENVVAIIPTGSNISVQNTTCAASLAVGVSCTITFSAGTQEGPTVIPIAGNNTNRVSVNVTVTSSSQISITNPVQQNRVVTLGQVTPLFLEITNDAGSAVNANDITVSGKTGCPNLSVVDSNCASVAPGASCLLELSSNTPYAPCTITVSGSNTANSPTALVAFFHLGGLVFEESGGSGKIVIDSEDGFTSQWTSTVSNIATAESVDDGVANTDAIIIDTACINDTNNCAAQKCRNISFDWYLPAENELLAVHDSLCSNLAIPCNFGGFLESDYWTSSQTLSVQQFAVLIKFPQDPSNYAANKFSSYPVRCVRSFP